MLNPGAIEFKPTCTKPTQTSASSNDTNQTNISIKANEAQQQNGNRTNARTNKPRKQKSTSHAASTYAPKHPNDATYCQAGNHGVISNVIMTEDSTRLQQGDQPKTSRKKQSSKQKTTTALSSTQQQKQGQQQQKKSSRQAQQQRRSTSHTTATTAATHDPIELEPTTSFITIDQTIDPVHVIPGTFAPKNTIIHGYERYITWIERCLQTHAVVTVVGMDPAISDVLSLVTIIQAKGIGSYHELATFSMESDGGRQQQHQISGIQLKLHRN